MKQDGFNLVGHATAPIGLGEDLRMMAAMLDYLGIPYAVSDVAYNRLDPVLPPFRFMTAAHYDISFFFNSAFANGRLRQGFPERFEGQRLTVGYIPWELPHFPKDETWALESTDFIWTPSAFARDSFATVSRKPMAVVPLPTALPARAGTDFRKRLGIPAGDFVVLYIFDMRSTTIRKNPRGTLEAFRKFAAARRDAWLVLKVHRLTPEEARKWEHDYSDLRVSFITDGLSGNEMADLYACADCYLSLHRSEGYGRTLVEALQAGLPIVTTGFSAPVEYLDEGTGELVRWKPVEVRAEQYQFSPGSWWADPDTDDAAAKLDKVYQGRRSIERERRQRAGQAMCVEVLARRYEPLFDLLLCHCDREQLADDMRAMMGTIELEAVRFRHALGRDATPAAPAIPHA